GSWGMLLEFLFRKIGGPLGPPRSRRLTHPRLNCLPVFPELYPFYFPRMLDGRGDAFEVLHRPQTNEKIEKLSERDVERPNSTAYRRCQRTFNPDEIFAKRLDRVV